MDRLILIFVCNVNIFVVTSIDVIVAFNCI